MLSFHRLFSVIADTMETISMTRFGSRVTNLMSRDKSSSILSVVNFVPSVPDSSYCLVFAQLYTIRRLVVRFVRRVRYRIFKKRNDACLIIQRRWHRAICNPCFIICRKRLLSEFNDLASKFVCIQKTCGN